MDLRSFEQERGAFAYRRILEVKDESWAEDYKSYVKSAPVMILTNGLGQTLAFYKSKKKEAYDRLFEDIDQWLLKRGYYTKDQACNSQKINDVLDWLLYCASSIEVMQATYEALALLNWLKRFADAMIEEKEEIEG